MNIILVFFKKPVNVFMFKDRHDAHLPTGRSPNNMQVFSQNNFENRGNESILSLKMRIRHEQSRRALQNVEQVHQILNMLEQ